MRKFDLIPQALRATSILAVCAAAGGCLVTKGRSITETGQRISQPTMSQIKPGETTEAWLIAAAGEPTSRRKVDDHTSILRYEHATVRSSGGAVLFLFAGHEQERRVSAALFEVRDGVITRSWTEG